LNVRYGGLHSRDVPKYRIVGRMSFFSSAGDSNDGKGGRNILGLPSTWRVFRRSNQGIEIGLSHRKVRCPKFASLTCINVHL
jgi:hypothetical protein